LQLKVTGTQQILRRQRHRTAICYLIATVALLGYWSYGLWFRLDFASLDLWLRLSATSASTPSDIVLIDIDDESINQLEPQFGRWPWPRSAYAYVLQAMESWQPNAVVFDVMLSGKDLTHPDDDAFYLETVSRLKQVYLPVSTSPDLLHNIGTTELPTDLFKTPPTSQQVSLLLPLGWQQVNNRLGLINANADSDGVFRRYPLYLRHGDVQLTSLPAQVAQGLGAPLPVQLDAVYLNYQNPQLFPYPRISFSTLLAMALQPKPEYAPLFSNKIIVIGSSATALADLKHTPINPQHPGMTLLATAIDNLLQQQYLQALPNYSLLPIWLLTIALWYFQLLHCSHSKQFLQQSSVTLSLMIILIALLGALALSQQRLLVFGTVVVLIVVTYALLNTFAALAEHKARQHTHQLFSRFVDARVIKELVHDDSVVATKKCQITVLFTDIRGFTSLSETLTPEQVMQLLNRYLALQVQTLFAHQATLDKFIGDAIMVFWGAPVAQANHADLAIAAALALEQNLLEFRQKLPTELQSLDIGIGIHTGEAVVGLLGTSQRQEYTAIGDTVNVASRLESASKQHGRIVCSAQTIAACSQHWPSQLVGEIHVKGRAQPVQLIHIGEQDANTTPAAIPPNLPAAL
jgi:adenylate cyclase